VTTKPTLLVASLAASLCSSAALAARVTYLAAPAAQRAIPASPWLRVDRGKLCVTNGVISALADGRLAIDTPSSVGNVIAEFNGPVGLRTDNARFELEYYAGPVDPLAQSSSAGNNVNPCRLSPGD